MSHQHHVGPSAEAWGGDRERSPRQELRGECRGGPQAGSPMGTVVPVPALAKVLIWTALLSSKLKTAGQTDLISRQAFPREPPDADVAGRKSILKRQ